MKLAFIDTETTGNDPKKHSIWQFSMQMYEDGEKIGEYYDKISPFKGDLGDDYVIKTYNLNIRELRKNKKPEVFVEDLKVVLEQHVDPFNKEDKLFLVAYSAVFDYDFLRSTFDRVGEKFFGSYFWYPPICAMQMAAMANMDERSKFINFKLHHVYELITGNKVIPERLHDADYDLQLLIELHKELDPDFWTSDDIPF